MLTSPHRWHWKKITMVRVDPVERVEPVLWIPSRFRIHVTVSPSPVLWMTRHGLDALMAWRSLLNAKKGINTRRTREKAFKYIKLPRKALLFVLLPKCAFCVPSFSSHACN